MTREAGVLDGAVEAIAVERTVGGVEVEWGEAGREAAECQVGDGVAEAGAVVDGGGASGFHRQLGRTKLFATFCTLNS